MRQTRQEFLNQLKQQRDNFEEQVYALSVLGRTAEYIAGHLGVGRTKVVLARKRLFQAGRLIRHHSVPGPDPKRHEALDDVVRQLLLEGCTTKQICEKTGFKRTCIQNSRARVLAKLTPEEIIPKPDRSSLETKVRQFRDWLFDLANCNADPCIKWLEIFGESL